MDVEFTVKTLEIDENLENKIKAMLAEGWQLVSGTKPVAIYHLQRMKQNPLPQSLMAVAGMGGITINEDEIYILRNGKLLKYGEDNLPENQPPQT